MNSLVLFNRLRPLVSNALFRRLPNAKPLASQSNFFCQSSVKPHVSYTNQIKMSKYNDVIKRPASGFLQKRMPDNHSYVWLMERITGIGSLTSIIAMFLHPCENADIFCAFIITLHAHWGVEAMMVDYLRPAVVGNFIPKLIPVLVLAVSASLLTLLTWVAIHGNGIAGTLQQLWYLDPHIEPYEEEDSKLK